MNNKANDLITVKYSPITTRSKLTQWISALKISKFNVYHKKDINDDPTETLKQINSKIKSSKKNINIIIIEEQ